MAVIRFFLGRQLLSVLLAVAVLGGGLWAWNELPIDAFPDATNVQVMVLTKAPGLSTSEVERKISYPIEQSMSGLPRVREVRSMSRNALSQVVIIFEDDVDIYFARQLVHERLADTRDELPPGVEAEPGPISTGLGEVYQYSLEAGYYCPEHPESWSKGPGRCEHDDEELLKAEYTPMQLRTIQDWVLAPQLRVLKGVNEVNSFGGYVKQYHVVPKADLLIKYDLSLQDLVEAIAANNANAGGGFVVRGDEQSYVVSEGLVRSREDIANIVLKVENGAPVLVAHVADVDFGPMTRQGAVTRDGQGEVVAGMVIMLKGENSREVVDRVKGELAGLSKTLPPGVKVRPFYDRTDLILASVNTVSRALLEGGVLVILVLFLFLWDIRGALIVALSLPLTASIALIVMKWYGVTANLMTLGGLAIAIGMVVDGAIVVVENVVAMMRDPANAGRSKRQVAEMAAREVARPIFFSIMVIVAVIIPLFTLEQIEGKMFKPMALTMIFAMAGSLLVALTVVPPLASLLASRKPERKGGNPVVRMLVFLYRPTLGWASRHRVIVALVSLALLLGTALVAPRLGTEFLPPLDEGSIAVNVVRLPSASLDGSRDQALLLEEMILEEVPEVETVVSKTGRAEIAEDPMGPEQNDLFIMLKPSDQWRDGVTKADLVEELGRIFGRVPGIRPSFSQPIALRVNELISGVKSDVAIKIYGDDLGELQEAAERIAPVLSSIDGAHDVKVEQSSGMRQILVTPKRDRLYRYGLNVEDINEVVETAVGGRVVGEVYEGQRSFGIQVRFPEEERNSPEAIERIPMEAPDGTRLHLGDVAGVGEVETPAQVSRDNARRRLLVECNVRGRDLGGFVAEAMEALGDIEKSLPSGYRLAWGGQFENQQRATERLMVVVPVALMLILLMQLSALRNLRSTLLVILNLPFSLVGGIGIIWLLDMNISVSVMVGLIVLFGMAVQHGTVLVAFIDELRGRGQSIADAVRQASIRRLRPLLMTKLTSLLGLIPMVLSTGPGSDIQRPLAAVVLGGLLFTTLLNMYVVPALYPWFHREGDLEMARSSTNSSAS